MPIAALNKRPKVKINCCAEILSQVPSTSNRCRPNAVLRPTQESPNNTFFSNKGPMSKIKKHECKKQYSIIHVPNRLLSFLSL